MPPRVGHRGFFITLEGGDGSGKSTQAALLARWLRRKRHVVHLTREPGGTPLGEKIRSTLFSSGWANEAELFLFQALRAQHVFTVIRRELAAGHVVICDRFADSTMAYQGYGLGMDRDLVAQLTEKATYGVVPNLTLILDEPAESGLRKATRRQLMEQRGTAFQRRVRNGFRRIAKEHPDRCRLIPVQDTPQETHQLIRSIVSDALARRRRP